ncbi:MAG: hypothetical protein JWP87_4599, partial [Labilithrix sp.]|nr:hypothetical protein [Labilithrix sp.]
HFSAFYPREDVGAGKPARELQLAEEHGRVEDEGWRLRKDGTRFMANVVITALRDAGGKLQGFVKVTRDLSRRRVAEQEPRDSEERFHHLVDAVTDYAIFMLDETGHIATWNVGAKRTKGYELSEVVGKHISMFYTPEDRAAGKPEMILETVRREGRYEDEGWRVRKDGTRFWANVVLTALRDDRGKLLGFAKVTRDLTERRRAEEELRRSEERFRLLVEGVDDYAIYMLDPTGHVSTWNSGAQKIKGYASDEIVGKYYGVFFTDEQRAAGDPERELARAADEGRFEEEAWRVKKDGSRFWANVVVTPLRNADKQLVGFAKVTRDLTVARAAEENARELIREQTARATAEEASVLLREERERYRALSHRLEVILDAVGDGILVQDQAGGLIYANAAAAKVSGFENGAALMQASASELLARFETLDERGSPVDPRELPGRKVLAGAPDAGSLLRVRDRRTGRQSWMDVRATAVIGTDGRPELAVNIWHDVTEDRRREEREGYVARATAALSSSLDYEPMLELLASLLVPGLADWCSIHLLDAEGMHLRNVAVAHADPAKRALAGEYQRRYPPDPRQRRGVWNVVRTGEAELYEEIAPELLAQGAQDPEHLELLRGVGMTSLIVVPIRVRDRVSGTLSLVAAESGRRYDRHDLALAEELGTRAGTCIENARLYASAQSAATRAEEASRVKDEFLATVSHELRTPLNAILGWASLLRDEMTGGPLAKGVDVIHRNARAQAKIIDDILDVSRIITGKLRLELASADLVTIARQGIEVVGPSALAKGIAIELAPVPGEYVVVADPERLQQVVWNLLSNAVKFTDAGGTVTIDIRREGSNLVLSVTDTGKGIDPAFVPHVFEAFKQADGSTTRRVGGLGLGLAIVRHIVQLHGGEVRVQSAGIGKGTTFAISLPVRAVLPAVKEAARMPSSSPPAPAVAAPSLNGLRVLVVDDEPDARELLSVVLERAGARVTTAASSTEGFELVKEFRPHVIVSDIAMPGEDGYGFMRRIRTLDPAIGGGIPSVALTAYTRAEDKTRALREGFTTHIGKPVNADELLAAVANLARFGPRPQAE